MYVHGDSQLCEYYEEECVCADTYITDSWEFYVVVSMTRILSCVQFSFARWSIYVDLD